MEKLTQKGGNYCLEDKNNQLGDKHHLFGEANNAKKNKIC